VAVREIKTGSGVRFVLPASLDCICRVDEALGRVVLARGWDVDAFAVRILLHEALMNAIVHGSGGDPEREVVVTVSEVAEGLTLVVEDSGEGFALERLRAPVDVLADGGRGIPLMRIYADEVRHNERGNVVTLFRRFESLRGSSEPAGAASPGAYR